MGPNRPHKDLQRILGPLVLFLERLFKKKFDDKSRRRWRVNAGQWKGFKKKIGNFAWR